MEIEIKDNERIDDLQLNNLKIIQNKDGFCFGIDSVLLANFVKSNSNKNVIVDFCSGSGVIPIIMSSKKKYKKIYIVGGGAKNIFLNHKVKEYTGLKVIPMPIEATSLGNIKIQMKVSN